MFVIVFVCGGCGLELFTYGGGFHRLDPKRVVRLYGGKCPRCGKRLEVPGGRLKFFTFKEFEFVPVGYDKSVVVSFKVSPYLNRVIEEVARKKGYSSKSEFIRDAVMRYLLDG
jgi:hypothetical protein